MAAFVDTNILIYAFADTASGPIDKVAIARALLTSLFIRTGTRRVLCECDSQKQTTAHH